MWNGPAASACTSCAMECWRCEQAKKTLRQLRFIQAATASYSMAKVLLRICLVCGLTFVAVVWFQVRQRSRAPAEFSAYKGLAGVSSNDPVAVKMERFAEQAAMDAWQRYRMRLQIHVSALPDFEQYLGRVSQDPSFRRSTEKDQRAEGLIGGAFVGEAIRRVHGGAWLEEMPDMKEAGPYPLKLARNTIWPVNWSFKRLINGPEDNVYHKYLVMVVGQTNGLNLTQERWTNGPNGLVPLSDQPLK